MKLPAGISRGAAAIAAILFFAPVAPLRSLHEIS